MSGTSADGVDAALVKIESGKVTFLDAASRPYPELLQNKLLALNTSGAVSLSDLVRLDVEIAIAFADTATTLVASAGGADRIVAIGSHGQTIFHQPDEPFPGTLQLGNASVIAKRTGVDTVADFRSADIACGGQGAPLTPAFNHAVFRAAHPRVILNLGGIANVTMLTATAAEESSAVSTAIDSIAIAASAGLDKHTAGFDTGPANTLLDAWIKKHLDKPYDDGGRWAKSGSCDELLLSRLLADPFFDKKPPKSTGPDYFNLIWLTQHLQKLPQQLQPEDVQSTLLELTARTAAQSITEHYPEGVEVVLCGGGAHNHYLRERLSAYCERCSITTTDQACGLHVDHCESVAFAWLAYRYMAELPGNLPEVTGASKQVILGALHRAS